MKKEHENHIAGAGNITDNSTPVASTEPVDLNDLPAMPHMSYDFTNLIRAIDWRAVALGDEAAREIQAETAITASSRYRKAQQIFVEIMNWDTEDVCELQEMLIELKSTFADPSIALSDVVAMHLIPTARFPRSLPKEGVWALDQDGYVLIGKAADTIIEAGYVIEAAQAAKARRRAGSLKT